MARFIVALILLFGFYQTQANETISRKFSVNSQTADDDNNTDMIDAIVEYSEDYNSTIEARSVGTCPTCTCGKIIEKIYRKDQVVTAYRYPWVGYMTYYGEIYCGATIINSKYAVTAGHCTESYRKERIQLRFGQYERFRKTGILRKVSKVLRPPSYSRVTFKDDISLVKFDKPINFGATVMPVCLPKNEKQSFAGLKGIVLGYGDYANRGYPSSKLTATEMPIMTHIGCQTVYGGILDKGMLCVYKPNTIDTDCQSDTGGSIVIRNNKQRYTQVGISSWGDGCGNSRFPGVYARITTHLKFIQNNTKDGCYCSH